MPCRIPRSPGHRGADDLEEVAAEGELLVGRVEPDHQPGEGENRQRRHPPRRIEEHHPAQRRHSQAEQEPGGAGDQAPEEIDPRPPRAEPHPAQRLSLEQAGEEHRDRHGCPAGPRLATERDGLLERSEEEEPRRGEQRRAEQEQRGLAEDLEANQRRSSASGY